MSDTRTETGTAKRPNAGCDVLFVYLPYGAVERPSIALGLLKQVLIEAGFTAEVQYANFDFAEQVGVRIYDAISRLSCEMVGEWTFSGAAFPGMAADHDAYMLALGEIFRPSVARDAANEMAAQLWPVRRLAEGFIARTVQEIVRRRPPIVGVSSMFQQHCAALALLRQLKAAAPDIVTLLGGANCEGSMGEAAWRNFPFIDYVVSGEADEVLPGLVRHALLYGAATPATLLPEGVLGRGPIPEGGPRAIGRARTDALDATPIPDYAEYFERLADSSFRRQVMPGLPVETSRGCWWGAVKHCRFCGLNGQSLSFRSKSPERVVREFAALATRHELSRFMVVDNILDLDYFKTVLPRLPSTGRGGYRIFYETKANLRRPQVALLRQAGVTWIQPGIESLSDRLLKLTGKGTTALINTRLLKWAREEGLYTFWNILVDIPEEADADYREIAALIPAIVHLQPPKAIKPIQVVRFSGYHENPERYGLRLAPAWPYRYIYPLEERELADLCYNFDVPGKRRLQQTQAATPTTDDPFRAGSGVAACHQAVVEWQRLHASPSKPLLCIEPRAGEALILDTRPVAALRLTTISALEAAILDFCDEGAPFASIEQRFAHATAPAAEPSAAPSSSPSGEAFSAAFRRLVERRWLVPLSGQYLALPLQGNVPSLPENRHFPGGCLARAGERGCATIP